MTGTHAEILAQIDDLLAGNANQRNSLEQLRDLYAWTAAAGIDPNDVERFGYDPVPLFVVFGRKEPRTPDYAVLKNGDRVNLKPKGG